MDLKVIFKIARRVFRSLHRLLNIDHLSCSTHQLLDYYKPMSTTVPDCQVLHVIQATATDPLSYTVPVWYRAVLCLDGDSNYTGPGGRLEELSFCKIRDIQRYKNLRGHGKEHEFLLVKIVHAGSGDVRYIRIDRSGRENDE